MRKPVYVIYTRKTKAYISLISAFAVRWLDSIIPLASLCSWAGRCVSYLVANPEDRFSHDEAPLDQLNNVSMNNRTRTFLPQEHSCQQQNMNHDMTKATKWVCAQRRLRSAWASAQSDQSSLSAWRNLGSLATHWAHSEDSDQTGFCWFCHVVAHIQTDMRHRMWHQQMWYSNMNVLVI